MSRIGKMPVTIPAGVTVKLEANNELVVKGPNGTLTRKLHPDMNIQIEVAEIKVERPSDMKKHKSLHGLTRTLISNMIIGVTEGYSKVLEVIGVGYRAAKDGKKLTLTLGYSHPVIMNDPDGVTTTIFENNKIKVAGIDKEKVGQFAAEIREKRKPEPYKGKGIRYQNERIKLKAGKAGKK